MTTKIKRHIEIGSFEELQLARKNLKAVIKAQESSAKESPIAKISKIFNGSKSLSKSIQGGFSDLNIQYVETIISSLLLSLKATRKYYVAYIVAKEMVPFVIKKVSETIKTKNIV